MKTLIDQIRHWWNPGYDCHSQGVIEYLYAIGHTEAARDVARLFGK